ncbi:MAG: 2-hydroxyglutaryl-CoA dehydratase [Myxococcota bacterium]|nr:2-hydroxyglutaryl-CoA dehydratase [Myxococcota bacterium]MDW8363802.1 hypothetical protein [Myxococcales bacterium]
MSAIADLDIERELAAFEAAERARLGIDAAERRGAWTDRMIDPQFTAAERPHTTLLVGGLTMAHDLLVQGALRGVGYRVRALDCPDNEALRLGKEFGNRGQCNPTYYTVGNLVKELVRLRDQEGLPVERILREYVFLTAGACGPCRFGMYVTEYRKALRDAGFDGFRVMLFQQTGGLKQATGEEAGLDLSPPFFFAIAKALLAGDVLNLMAYRLRPYELEPGATDRALEQAKRIVHDALAARSNVLLALRKARRLFAAIPVDRVQARPKVAILGEFWAMTTEGDGNYRLQRFIEQEGGECDIQILAGLLLYNLWEARHDTELRAKLRGADGGPFGLEGVDVGVKMAGLWLGELVLRGAFHTFAHAVGLRGYRLPDMDEVAAVGHSHYNVNLRGGEGHMEVAKVILNVLHRKAHMTISVKPFGCMPSSGVSDGVQTVVTERHPDTIFCAVETSGDGAVNFHSRVQMFLFKARARARQELDEALARYGLTREQAAAAVAHTHLRDPLARPLHRVAGTAADVVHEIGPLVTGARHRRWLARASLRIERLADLARHEGRWLLHAGRSMAPYLPSLLRWIGREAWDYIPGTASLRDAWNRHVRDRLLGREQPARRAAPETPGAPSRPVAAATATAPRSSSPAARRSLDIATA